MEVGSVTAQGISLQSVVSMAMLDKSMDLEKQVASQMLEGLNVGSPAAGEVGSRLDVYA